MDSFCPGRSPAMSSCTVDTLAALDQMCSGFSQLPFWMKAFKGAVRRAGANVQKNADKPQSASIGPGPRHRAVTAILTTASSSIQPTSTRSFGSRVDQNTRQKNLLWVIFQEIGVAQTSTTLKSWKCSLCLMLAKLNFLWAVAKQLLAPTVLPRKCPDTGERLMKIDNATNDMIMT